MAYVSSKHVANKDYKRKCKFTKIGTNYWDVTYKGKNIGNLYFIGIWSNDVEPKFYYGPDNPARNTFVFTPNDQLGWAGLPIAPKTIFKDHAHFLVNVH